MDKVLTPHELSEIITPLLKHYGLKSALLFGSYARGEATPESDIDLIIDGGPSFRPLSIYALGETLREQTGKRVDVFEISELDEGPFKQKALAEGVEL
ncbi:nucleotidyltransferase domain-containing protein [Collinsella tanakaei]|nr:nucleotidyltransferase domain-containing protein [Collinsella tanakaei]